jgi:hypothetical protein
MVYVAIGVVIGVLLSAGTIALAGTLDPASGPTDPGSQMYTLQQIYARLTSGEAGTKMSTFTEPGSGPGTGTMVTLDQVMAAAPAVQTNAATPEEVVSGSVVWGLSEEDWGVIEGTRPYLPLPKTGQTTCYETTGDYDPCDCGSTEWCPAGQDGDWQMGIDPLTPRFTNNNDGTVTDNMTGLIWLQNANCQGTEYGSNWFNAMSNVAELNATGEMIGTDSVRRNCGDISNGGSHQTDWRLPNVREMHSLIDYGVDHPSLTIGHPFENVYSRWYWTSTTHLTYHGNAWFVSMWGGRVFHLGKNATYHVEDPLNYRLYIWPVRGGQQ